MTDIEAGTFRLHRKRRRLRAGALAAAAIVLAAASVMSSRAFLYRNTVLPGVSVAGVEVGGLERRVARARIELAVADRLENPVAVTVGPRTLTIRGSDLYELDVAATERRAFAAARESVWARAIAVGLSFAHEHDVQPVLTARADGRAALAAALARIERDPVSARVELDGV
jgi:hypothetical protein